MTANGLAKNWITLIVRGGLHAQNLNTITMLVDTQEKLKREIAGVLNANSVDVFLDTPDYAIADLFVGIILKMDDVNKEKAKHSMASD